MQLIYNQYSILKTKENKNSMKKKKLMKNKMN